MFFTPILLCRCIDLAGEGSFGGGSRRPSLETKIGRAFGKNTLHIV